MLGIRVSGTRFGSHRGLSIGGRTRRRGGGKQLGGDKKATAMFGAVGTVVIGLLIAIWLLKPAPVDDDLCIADHRPPAHYFYLVDPSDPISRSSLSALRNDVGRRVASMRPGERLTVVALGSDDERSLTTTLFSRCHPGDGRDTSAVAGNRRLAEKRFTEQFRQPLDEALGRLGAIQPAQWSPILEALHAVATAPAFSPDIPRRALTIYSDLLQHSDLWSDYGGKKAAAGNRQRLYDSAYLSEMRDALAGVELHVYQLARNGKAPAPDHQTFWKDYFALTGAPVEIRPL